LIPSVAAVAMTLLQMEDSEEEGKIRWRRGQVDPHL
jgi:hypothetical protein